MELAHREEASWVGGGPEAEGSPAAAVGQSGEGIAVLPGEAERLAVTTPAEVAGFGRRVAADLIDLIILVVSLFLLAFAYRSWVFRLGPWGPLVGFAAAVFYWGRLNPRASDSATLGKSWMGLAILDESGNDLPRRKLALRAVVLWLTFLLGNQYLPINNLPLLGSVLPTAVFFAGLAVSYGIAFNRVTRQGLHDLVAGSIVIRDSSERPLSIPAITRRHRRITLALPLLGLLLGLIGWLWPDSSPPVSGASTEALNLAEAIYATGDFHGVNVQYGRIAVPGSREAAEGVNVWVWWKGVCPMFETSCYEWEEAARQIARTVLANYERFDRVEMISISIESRFDLLVAQGNRTNGMYGNIAYWREETGQ
jgi:uncharacterized RDD family membrane protein YckC